MDYASLFVLGGLLPPATPELRYTAEDVYRIVLPIFRSLGEGFEYFRHQQSDSKQNVTPSVKFPGLESSIQVKI